MVELADGSRENVDSNQRVVVICEERRVQRRDSLSIFSSGQLGERNQEVDGGEIEGPVCPLNGRHRCGVVWCGVVCSSLLKSTFTSPCGSTVATLSFPLLCMNLFAVSPNMHISSLAMLSFRFTALCMCLWDY